MRVYREMPKHKFTGDALTSTTLMYFSYHQSYSDVRQGQFQSASKRYNHTDCHFVKSEHSAFSTTNFYQEYFVKQVDVKLDQF